jgi:hypothetical protein
LLAKLVAEKCVLRLPLDRQRRGRAPQPRHSDKTLQSYWATTRADLLRPIADAYSLVFGQALSPSTTLT